MLKQSVILPLIVAAFFINAVVLAKNKTENKGLEIVICSNPTPTISVDKNSSCLNDIQPTITFSINGGTGPYKFYYSINGIAGIEIKSTGDSGVIKASTTAVGVFTYTFLYFIDATGNKYTVNSSLAITINSLPDTTLTSDAELGQFDGNSVFKVCSSSTATILFANASKTIGTNVNYILDWGDSSIPSMTSSWETIAHQYAVGTWSLKYTIKGNNGCEITKAYTVFVGTNPSVSLVNPGNTDICVGDKLTFPISGVGNPQGTKYTVSFNDGSVPVTYTQATLPSTLMHVFSRTSCGVTSSDGTNSYSNSFSGNIQAENPCGTSSVGIVPIYVSTPPTASFITSSIIGCVNTTSFCIENTSTGATLASSGSCNLNAKTVWTITPSSGFSLEGGSLGNDYGNLNSNIWISGTSTLCPKFFSPGEYTIRMRVGNRCGIDEITKKIYIESPLDPKFSLDTDLGCVPLNVTAVNNTMATASQSAKYLWSISYTSNYCGSDSPEWKFTNGTDDTSTNPSFYFVTPGTYTITLTATNSCGSFSSDQKVSVTKPPEAIIDSLTTICEIAGGTSIHPTAKVKGCVPDSSLLTYSWKFPGGIPANATSVNPGSINYITPGTYTISLSVTNECGMNQATNQTITINPLPKVVVTPAISVCAPATLNLTNLLTTIDSDSALTFSYWVDSMGTISLNNPDTIVNSGTYYIKGTNAKGCYSIQPIVATVYDLTTITGVLDVCLNNNPVLLIGSGTKASNEPWISLDPSIASIDDNGLVTNKTVGKTTITYTTNNGCKTQAFFSVNNLPSITINPLERLTVCMGGEISLKVEYKDGAGAPSYQWYSNTSNSTIGGVPIAFANSSSYTPEVFATSGTFYYFVVIAFERGCSAITSTTSEVVVLPDPILNSQPLSTQRVCINTIPTNLEVTVAGGIGNTYLYQWYSNTNRSTTNATLIPSATNPTFTPPTSEEGAQFYYCSISQTNISCGVISDWAEVIIIAEPSIAIQPVSGSVCLGTTSNALFVVSKGGSGATSYQWYSNTTNSNTTGISIAGETNSSFTPPSLLVGPLYYYCQISFSLGGCFNLVTDAVLFQVNPNPEIKTIATFSCSGKSFQVNPATIGSNIVPFGTTYSWSTPTSNPVGAIIDGTAQDTSQDLIGQILTNKTGTTAKASYSVTPFSGICLGNPFIIDVEVNPAINLIVQQENSRCYGSNNGSIKTEISGGTGTSGTYTISWLGPNGFASSQENISNLTPGNYTISITDLSPCTITTTYTITEPQALKINTLLQKNASCFGAANGEIQIDPTGGTAPYTYSWTKNDIPFSKEQNKSNLSPGNYSVTIIDANNCDTITANYVITEPFILEVRLVKQTNIWCYGDATGAISVNTTGGTPIPNSPFGYLYSWIGPKNFKSSNQNLTAIIAGTYQLTVTDLNGCQQQLQLALSQPDEIIVNVVTAPIICYGNNNASIHLEISGGVPPYQTVWDNLGSGISQNNLSAGTYQVTITDMNSCSKKSSITINESQIFTVNSVVKEITCHNVNDGSILLNIIGGTTPVKLVWTDDPTAGYRRNNLPGGIYSAIVTDGKGCSITKNFVLLDPQEMAISANSTDATDCNNANSGAINVLVSGGTPPFTYQWSNGTITEDLKEVPAGNYSVIVSDARGCIQSLTTVIYRQFPIVIGVDTKTDFNCETKEVKQTFIAQVSGGVPPYQLVWSSGTISGLNNEIMNTSQNGTITLGATDHLGCVSNYNFVVQIPILGDPNFETDSYGFSTYGMYSIVDPITFKNKATGDFISMVWDFGDSSISSETNPNHSYLSEGDYEVTQTITYPFGCVYKLTLPLTIEKGYWVVVPNAFSPNKDGINDVFRPVSKGLSSIKIEIFDTWGELLYSEEGTALKGWNGMTKERFLTAGNYYCKVIATTFYGAIQYFEGPFILIR